MIVLSSDKELECGDQKCIYKYQSAESLIREVMVYCQESAFTDASFGYEKKIQLMGIYSPLGRCARHFLLLPQVRYGEKAGMLFT